METRIGEKNHVPFAVGLTLKIEVAISVAMLADLSVTTSLVVGFLVAACNHVFENSLEGALPQKQMAYRLVRWAGGLIVIFAGGLLSASNFHLGSPPDMTKIKAFATTIGIYSILILCLRTCAPYLDRVWHRMATESKRH